MKKIKFIATLISVVLILSISGCSEKFDVNSDKSLTQSNKESVKIKEVIVNKPHKYKINNDGKQFETIDLPYLSESGLIVIGEFVEDAHSIISYIYDPNFDKGIIRDSISYNRLLVTEVLKGDVKLGDIITIQQNYRIEEGRGALVSYDGLTPMNKGDRWIYFLNSYDNDEDIKDFKQYLIEYFNISDESELDEYANAYINSGMYEEGRYPVPDKGIADAVKQKSFDKIDSSALGLLNRGDFDFALYAQLLDHFKIEAQDWVNPGRDYDAKLVEIVEKQLQEIYADCLD